MTGMKSGASGDNQWGDDDTSDDAGEESSGAVDSTSTSTGSVTSTGETGQPYIVQRAIEDAGTQFQRDTRLTFFVRDRVADGEKQLRRQAEDRFGRDVPKFDLREAVYLAAMENPDAVLAKLDDMGYERD